MLRWYSVIQRKYFVIFMICIDKSAKILIFVQINDSYDVSQSMYIDLLPIPFEHAKVQQFKITYFTWYASTFNWLKHIHFLKSSLQKGSSVYITKAARSRIILEAAAACHQNVNGNRKRKADALLGPKTIIRHALIEMFGRAQLAEASACGSHGKKAIRKHVLQALYREYNFYFSIINLFFIILALLNH